MWSISDGWSPDLRTFNEKDEVNMSYEATVINVMIAGPSDVAIERKMLKEVVQEWNSINSEDKRIVLMPTSWDTHSSPKMGERAQVVINEQVLEHCDVLVAIFWTRLGSPTGDSRSGTVEEIEKHMKSGKPAMIYFSSAPVRLDSVDDEQYKALQDFRRECEGKGLIETYETISEFRDKFTRQLAQTILRSFASIKTSSTDLHSPQIAEQIPELSEEAKHLLVEASEDQSGIIMKVLTMGGTLLQTNGKEFIEQGNPRSEAKWEAALKQLVSHSLIEDRGYKGEIFVLTDNGFHVADLIKNK